MARTLLVVDDSSTIRQAVRLALTGEDWNVLTANSSDEALELVESRRPDAVLCDVTPDREGDGYEICRSIRTSAGGAGTPVILMGGKISDKAAAAAGTTVTLAKPFGSEELLGCLEEALEQGSFSLEGPDFTAIDAPVEARGPGEETFETVAVTVSGASEGEEVEIIDLSDAEDFEDVELLEGLEPLELAPEARSGEVTPTAVGAEPGETGLQAEQETETGPFSVVDLDLGPVDREEEQTEGAEGEPGTDGIPVLDLEAQGEEPVSEFELTDTAEVAAAEVPEQEGIQAPEAFPEDEETAWGEPEPSTDQRVSEEAPSIDIFEERSEEQATEAVERALSEPGDLEAAPKATEAEEVYAVESASGEDLSRPVEVDLGGEPTGEAGSLPPGAMAEEEEALPETGATSEFGEEFFRDFEAGAGPTPGEVSGEAEPPAEESPDLEAVRSATWETSDAEGTGKPGHPEEIEITGTSQAVEGREGEEETRDSEVLEWTPEAAFTTPGQRGESEAFEELRGLEEADARPEVAAEPSDEGTTSESFVDFGEDIPAVEPAWPEPPPEETSTATWDTALSEGAPATRQLQESVERAVRESLEASLTPEKLGPVVERAVERVVWEVVPQLAERLIQEAIRKLREKPSGE